jgi:hypothetical protein
MQIITRQVPQHVKHILGLGHLAEETIRKLHPADVDGEIEIIVAKKIVLEPLPD